ncbi:cupin domain-containing protein [Sphingomonas lacunae]|uniref:Cupin domain-containing protein n=1 Tax=Sphingomonas lacunae TaxID=2698828 RepID=A0A6M4AVQ9_9SPHN|nr:cupin domain-containing protein [Sphingomonas lacunae]QJQ31071.1 cupin domain-containing protein [Sphingomonas lacunae]
MSLLLTLLLGTAPPMVVVDEQDVMRREPPPHGAIGMSTAWRISDVVPQPRTMEFRRRALDPGAAIGEHLIDHDEVYYVLSGRGEVTSDGVTSVLEPGMAAYLYSGAVVGIRQTGEVPLNLIIAYPVTQATAAGSRP